MNKRRQQGLTLIEILVATAIAAVILAGVVQLFSGMKQSEQLSMSLARLQENGRFAVDVLSRELRMAGYQGCSNPNQDFIPGTNIIAKNFPATDIARQVIQGTTVAGDKTASLFGGNVSITGAVAGTDVVSTIYASPVSASLNADMTSGTDALNLGSTAVSFAVGDFLLISNCTAEGQFIFRASSVASGPPVTIGRDTDYNTAVNFGSLLFKSTDPTTTVQHIVLNTYYIKENLRGIPSLYRKTLGAATDDELIEGVENLKLLYAHYDDKGTASPLDDTVEWVSAATINSSPSYDWGNVTSIKAAVLLSGEQDVLTDNGPDKYDMLGTEVTITADKRLRRVFSTSVKVRNRDGKRISM